MQVARRTAPTRLSCVVDAEGDLQGVQRLPGSRRPWKRAIIAAAGFPGMSRGMRKFTVSAAQSVSTKNPSRSEQEPHRRRRLTAPAGSAQLFGAEVQEHLLPVRDTATPPAARTGRPGVGPAGECLVLYWYQSTLSVDRDHRDVVEHHLLQLLHDLVLLRLVGRGAVLRRSALSDGRVRSSAPSWTAAFSPSGAEFFVYRSCRSS